MISIDNTPPPIALEPLLAFPTRDPTAAGFAGPGPGGVNQIGPSYFVGGYRSLLFNFVAFNSPAPPAPVIADFVQGWPIDSLPSGAGGGPSLGNNIRPVWQHRAVLPQGAAGPLQSTYFINCRIPVVAPLFSWSVSPLNLSTSGTQYVQTATVHGTDQHCSQVEPLDASVVLTTSTGNELRNRRFLHSGGVVPAGAVIDFSGDRRWYCGRAYITWGTSVAAGASFLQIGTGSSTSMLITQRVAAGAWQTDEVEIPSDALGIAINAVAGTTVNGIIGLGTQPTP